MREGTSWLAHHQTKALATLVGTTLPVLSSPTLSFLTMKREVLGTLSVQRSQERGITSKNQKQQKEMNKSREEGKSRRIRASQPSESQPINQEGLLFDPPSQSTTHTPQV